MKIIAHRGASKQAPENTFAAIRRAGQLGADGIEIDVHLTRDGHLAVIHDKDTRRVSPKEILHVIKESPLAKLQALDIGSWMHPRFSRERVPELAAVLRALKPKQEILIELKSREGGRVLRALDRAFATAKIASSRVIVMSFHDSLARKIKQARPKWRVLRLLAHEPSPAWLKRFMRDVKAGRLDGIGQNGKWTLSAADYKNLRAAGAILSVWTVDDPRRGEVFRRHGFHYLTTNVPDEFR